MSFDESVLRTENALRELLRGKQVGIDDRTGKGASAEALIEQYLRRGAFDFSD
jgi:hypothetical protein